MNTICSQRSRATAGTWAIPRSWLLLHNATIHNGGMNGGYPRQCGNVWKHHQQQNSMRVATPLQVRWLRNRCRHRFCYQARIATVSVLSIAIRNARRRAHMDSATQKRNAANDRLDDLDKAASIWKDVFRHRLSLKENSMPFLEPCGVQGEKILGNFICIEGHWPRNRFSQEPASATLGMTR